MNNLIIPNTSLCAIVRDEKDNPAGGIVDFVKCSMPFMEEGVIVDTGSLDGTRELLEEMALKYPNLKIFDIKFEGYANARNFSLKKVQTKYAFVLDADERLSKEDFADLKDYMKLNSLKGYNFEIKGILPDGEENYFCGIHNPRLFRNDLGFKYKSSTKFEGEYLFINNLPNYRVKTTLSTKSDLEIYIKHFVPDCDGKRIKSNNWYYFLTSSDYKEFAPSQTNHFEKWKKRNPSRDNYPFGV